MRWPLCFILSLLTACVHQPDTEESQVATVPENEQTVHTAALVLDAHADIEIPGKYSAYVGDDGLSQVAPDKMREGGVDAVVMSISVSAVPRTKLGYENARVRAGEELNAVMALAEADDGLVLVRSPAELVEAHQKGQQALILGVQNAALFAQELANIDLYYEQGVRVFAFTHLGHNAFADSSRPGFIRSTGKHEPEAEHGGLSALGRMGVQRINVLGGVLDVSQLSKTATLELVELSSAPVIASHSNVRALTDVTRNLSDQEIDAIAAKGGVVHVTPFRGYLYDSKDSELDAKIREARIEAGITEDYYYPFELYWEIDDSAVKTKFIGAISALLGEGSIDAVLDHVDYLVNRVGIEHVGFGSDFNHGGGIAGLNDASDALNLTLGLLERGYSSEDISKFWGGNFIRVWLQAQSLVEE